MWGSAGVSVLRGAARGAGRRSLSPKRLERDRLPVLDGNANLPMLAWRGLLLNWHMLLDRCQ